MAVIYTVEQVRFGPDSDVERHSALFNITNLKLELIQKNLIKSYSVTDNRKFPFPIDTPDPVRLEDFFGEDVDHEKINEEISELYDPKRGEYSDSKSLKFGPTETLQERFLDFVSDLSNKTNLGIQKYTAMVKDRYQEGINYEGINKRLLQIGNRFSSVFKNYSNFEDWPAFMNYCAHVSQYGDGFYIARLTVDKENLKEVKEVLKKHKNPYKIVMNETPEL